MKTKIKTPKQVNRKKKAQKSKVKTDEMPVHLGYDDISYIIQPGMN